ncbi:MAG: DUF6209 family protein [Pseudomonadota bacterium]
MKTLRSIILVSSLVGLCSCGLDLDGDQPVDERALAGDQTYGPLASDADLATPPGASINFGENWGEYVNQMLYAGAELMITAHPSRFTVCGTTGRVHAGLRYADGDTREVLLDQGWPGYDRWAMTVLRADVTAVEIWLWADNDAGCVEYDSAFGDNYHFALRPWKPVRVRFSDDWSERVEGELHADSVLVIDYDWDRLPQCRVVYRGFENWEILAHLRFDDGTYVPTQSVTRYGGQGDNHVHPVLAVYPVPVGARHVELWFENTQYPPTCQAWDSDFGHNYHFDIAP